MQGSYQGDKIFSVTMRNYFCYYGSSNEMNLNFEKIEHSL
jgi:hypothetical protein